jgi:hypothetical protein
VTFLFYPDGDEIEANHFDNPDFIVDCGQYSCQRAQDVPRREHDSQPLGNL